MSSDSIRRLRMSSYDAADAAAAAAADSDTWRDVTGAWPSAPAVNSSARQPACLQVSVLCHCRLLAQGPTLRRTVR